MTIERPMFPPRAENVVALFPQKSHVSATSTDFPETRRQRASSKRNPVRRLYSQAGIAVTIAGKLHRGEALLIGPRFDDKEWLRRGAEAARLLADELARLVEHEAQPARLVEKYHRLSPEDQRMIDAEVQRILEERQP